MPLPSCHHGYETFVETHKAQKKGLICLILPPSYQFNSRTAIADKRKTKPYLVYFEGFLSVIRNPLHVSLGGSKRNPIQLQDTYFMAFLAKK